MNPKHSKTSYAIFAGGETAGPIVPLLAVASAWRKDDQNLHPIFIDVKNSVAERLCAEHHFPMHRIMAGKFRRYWSFKNFAAPVQLLVGFVQALRLIGKYRPKIVVGAGGYAQVPIIVAAWLCRIPRVIHQQDVTPTLSNLLMAPLANKITTAFEKSAKDFPQGSGFGNDYSKLEKVIWVGSPTSPWATGGSKAEAEKFFSLANDWPTILIMGGGSGAAGINSLVSEGASDLTNVAQIIHSTGTGKQLQIDLPRYHQYEFINRMDLAYAAADLVVTRAGVTAITELSLNKKPAIVIPMPGTHQEANAALLFSRQAAIVLDQTELTADGLVKIIRKLLHDGKMQTTFSKNIGDLMPKDATKKLLNILQSVVV